MPRMKRLVVAAVTAALMMVPTPAYAAPVDYVVDGDTIRLRSGVYVRLIGIDTPEEGQCGYQAAKRKLNQWVDGNARLVNPKGVDNQDGYDRLLRYVHDSGRDTGLGLIKRGLAKARYDGRDGYDRHPRQATYLSHADRFVRWLAGEVHIPPASPYDD